MRCDFCGGEARWRYETADFVVGGEDGDAFASDGDWAVCSACARLIDRRLGADLATRVLHAWLDAGAPLEVDLAGEIVQAFFDHRLGDREPIE